jgi:hypothetical protein
MIAEQPHPMVQAIAADLAAHLPRWAAPTMHELRGIASLAAALDITGAEIMAEGCTEAHAHTFGQLAGRLGDYLDELGTDRVATSLAAQILSDAAKLTGAVLALMPPAGTA